MVSPEKATNRPEGEQKLAAPSISLPKGGGAIRGIGEKFGVNPVTGTGSLTIPIYTSPGRAGFGPQLTLSYDSGAGNGPVGFGCKLSLPSITRKTDKGLPRYEDAADSDVFILSGAEDLVPLLVKQGNQWRPEAVPPRTVGTKTYGIQRYRPRIEGLFARIERWTNQNDETDVCWRSISKDNTTTWYGKTQESRIFDPSEPSHIFSWLICESYDDKGNAIHYKYEEENDSGIDLSQVSERNRSTTSRKANRYLKRIQYGNKTPRTLDEDLSKRTDWLFETVLDYDETHYEDVPPNQTIPLADQHQFVLASIAPGSAWFVRPDPFSTYRAGFEVRTYRRCRRVLMFHMFQQLGTEPCLVKSTEFEYADFDYKKPFTVEAELSHKGSTRIASFIRAVRQSGYVADSPPTITVKNGLNYVTYLKRSLPDVEFDYSQAIIDETVRDVDAESLENLPYGLDGGNYQWVVLDGDGLSGILTEQAEAWFYKRNLSPGRRVIENNHERTEPQFGPVEVVATIPALSLAGGQVQFLDLAGDGRIDVATFGGSTPGFHERTQDETWEPFKSFTSLPNLAWNDPNLKFIDLTGDGHADILITEHGAFVWHPSLAEAGFARSERVAKWFDEEQGPALVFADGTQSIYVADLSGDGLTDLVRIRNGEVCYWPNLGYGRFGAKVTMDNAPWFDWPDLFDQRRIRLADIDGSGVTDIIYLGGEEVTLYFNQSGNRLSQPRHLTQFPKIDNLASIQVTDLLGNGTACLVWASALPGDARHPMRYVGLMKDGKPHLLINTKNNLGAETRVQYAPSTKFYVEDRLAGTPWITKLPFPVHVIERVETYDRISQNRFVSRYSYHHGCFDGGEREWRGFARSEQRLTAEIGKPPAIQAAAPDTNWDAASFVPPVLTKTWVHTGAYFERDQLEAYFKRAEYYQGDPQAVFLPDTVLPNNLSAQEEREACRALKGAMLRQEVYTLDGSPKEAHPYIVSEQNYSIESVQPVGINRHAVFFTHPRETLSYHYERNPADPRIGHELILKVDGFGNVERSLTIGYPRRNVLGRLPEQAQTHMVLTVNRVANQSSQPDWYRVGLPVETRTFEISKPPQAAGGGGVFSWNALNSLTESLFPSGQVIPPLAQTIPYENWDWRSNWNPSVQPGGPGVSKLRLIEHVRTRYRPNDLGQSRSNNPDALLPLGAIESLALPGESYKLAFTPGLLANVYGRGATNFIPTPADLLGAVGPDKGGYVDLDGDGNWWVPSGRSFYHPTTGALPQTELIEATSHFFLPRRVRDPFGNEAVVTYHGGYDLLVNDTRDAVGNTVVATNDYRVLQPSLITDPNGNRSAAYFDALGLVVATAVMGKTTETKGDSLANFDRDEANPTLTQLRAFIADPRNQARTSLNDASTRIMYDLDRFTRCGQPTFASTLARETHASDPVPTGGHKVQITFAYSDGFGRQVQTKVQAEQGNAPQRNNPIGLASGDIAPGALQLQNGQPQLVTTQQRSVGTGRTVFNDRGKPIKQYEPFFSSTHLFETEPEVTMTGVTPILFYDPVERVIATLHPNHTYEKVVFDPWRQITYDVNDTVKQADPKNDPHVGGFFKRLQSKEYLPTWHTLRTDAPLALQKWPDTDPVSGNSLPQNAAIRANERTAAQNSEAHDDTPTTAHFDALGRTVLTLAHNGKDANGNDILFRTSVLLDIEGNQREVRDAKLDQVTRQGRIVMQYDYDLLSTPIHQKSMEAPEQWMLNDVLGKPIRVWKSPPRQVTDPEQMFETHYDVLRRPTRSFVEGFDPTNFGRRTLYQQIVYGDDLANGPTPAQSLNANLRAKIYQQFDGAGIITNVTFDFKGNLLEGSRQLTDEYQQEIDWLNPPQGTETFVSRTTYDALNRPVMMTTPYNTPAMSPSTIRPFYNEAGLLNSLSLNLRGAAATTDYVTNINYNEKGQRTQIDYGNDTITKYAYDPLTFRLARLETMRSNSVPTNERSVQDLQYTYDPVGNITHIQDDADIQNVVFFNNQRVDPSANYLYDPIYRLIAADGREHIGQAGQPETSWDDAGRVKLPHPHNGQAMRQYVEQYAYDEVGNFDELVHRNGTLAAPGQTIWRRQYAYGEDSLIEDGSLGNPLRKSNRLSQTIVGRPMPGQLVPETYPHDRHGNITSMPHLQTMDWDFNDQLRHIRQGTMNAYYVYDASGQRIRKVVEKNNGTLIEERIYLGGFEVFRQHPGPIGANTATLERETLHVMDDKQRIALVETKTIPIASPLTPHPSLIRYQFGNHLGSAILELDDNENVISYEEYHPYGTTSYQAGRTTAEVSLKRYRYTGKERDEESGLYYHGARYYAAWLGRWTSCDPIPFADGANAYEYVRSQPTRLRDRTGQYAEAGHYYTVYVVALAAGFDPDTARKAATYAQAPDEITELSAAGALGAEVIAQNRVNVKEQAGKPVSAQERQAVLQAEQHRDRIHRGLHALTGGQAEPERANRVALVLSLKPGTPEHGMALHSLGDSFTHTIPPTPPASYDNPGPNPTGSPVEQQFEPRVGHAPAPHGLRPDQISERPKLYGRYVRALFATLSEQAKGEGLAPRVSKKEINDLIMNVTSPSGLDPESVEILRLREFAEQKLEVTLHSWKPELTGARPAANVKSDPDAPPELRNLDIKSAESTAADWANPSGNWTKTRAKLVPFNF